MNVAMSPNRMSLRKRYEKPDKLTDLLGPEQGTITLPIELYWQPGGSVFQIEDDADLATAYRSVLNEGSKEDWDLGRFSGLPGRHTG